MILNHISYIHPSHFTFETKQVNCGRINTTSLFFSYLCKYLSNTVAHVKALCEESKIVLHCICKQRNKTCDTYVGAENNTNNRYWTKRAESLI